MNSLSSMLSASDELNCFDLLSEPGFGATSDLLLGLFLSSPGQIHPQWPLSTLPSPW
jgi:hypothetical protein